MTTKEFIKKINALSEDEREGMNAKIDTEGNVLITKTLHINGAYSKVASLSSDSRSWHFYYSYDVPGCVLALMGELASDEYWGKFLILNGEPENSFWNFFIIGEDGQLFNRCEDNLDELFKFACTKEELNELKEGLSQRMQKGIDALTVPFVEALEMGEDNETHHD